MRSAWAARLAHCLVALDNTLPPDIFVPGHKPIHEVKCLTVGKRFMSTPISLMTFSAVLVSMPGMRVRSTPLASQALAGQLVHLQRTQQSRELRVALRDLACISVDQGQCLLARKQVLVAPVALQRGGDVGLARFDAPRAADRSS